MNIYQQDPQRKKIKCVSYLSERYTHGAPNSLTSARKVRRYCCRLSGAIYNIGYWLKQEYSTTLGQAFGNHVKQVYVHLSCWRDWMQIFLLVGFLFTFFDHQNSYKCYLKQYRQKDR